MLNRYNYVLTSSAIYLYPHVDDFCDDACVVNVFHLVAFEMEGCKKEAETCVFWQGHTFPVLFTMNTY